MGVFEDVIIGLLPGSSWLGRFGGSFGIGR